MTDKNEKNDNVRKGNLYFSFYPSDSKDTEVKINCGVDDMNTFTLDELQQRFYQFANALGYQVYVRKEETPSIKELESTENNEVE